MTMRAVALAGLRAVSAAGSRAEEKKAKPPVYKTPQAAFDAWVAAMKKHDFKAMADCMSPTMQKESTAHLAVGALALRAGADGDDEEARKLRKKYTSLFDALDKHGLGREATKKIKIEHTPEGRWKSADEVAPLIKEPKAVLVALQAAYKKAGLLKLQDEFDPKLKDVKITGDRAASVMTAKVGGKEAKLPQHFVKAGGRWLLTTPPKEKGAP